MTQYITLEKNQTRLRFLNRDLYEIDSNGMMINQLNGNPLDGSLNQLYLRVYTSEGIRWTPMVGLIQPVSLGIPNSSCLGQESFWTFIIKWTCNWQKIAGFGESS